MQPLSSSSFFATAPTQPQIPTCSSSDAYTSNTPTLRNCTLQQELFNLGVIDAQGVVSAEFLNSWKPLPLEEESRERLRQINDVKAFEKITVKSCFNFFQMLYGDDFGDSFLIGGAALWVLGWRYYFRVLESIGVSNPERFIPEAVKRKFNNNPVDYDFRTYTTARLAVSYPQVVKDVENMIKGKLKLTTLKTLPCRHLNNKLNQSLNIQLPPFEFTLWNKLNASYLFGHKAIQVPCKAALHSGEDIVPESPGIPLLQALLDELLLRVDPYPDLNHQGKIRHVQALTSGYTIWSHEWWDKLTQNKFPVEKGKTIGEHLYNQIEHINNHHPHHHPAGHVVNGINTVLLFGNRVAPKELKRFWCSYPESAIAAANAVHPTLSQIVELGKKGSTLPSSFLVLAAFVCEIFLFDLKVRSRIVNECSFQLQWLTDDDSTLSIQTQYPLHSAYENFVMQTVKEEDVNLVEMLIDAMFPSSFCQINPNSTFKEYFKIPGIQLRELRRRVISQLARPEPTITKMNFYLLAAMHVVDPLPVTESALLEFLPIIQPHQSLVNESLGIDYSPIYTQYHQHLEQNPGVHPHFLWLRLLFRKINFKSACKAVDFIPKVQKHLSEKQYQEILERLIKEMLEKFPEQRLHLVVNSLKQIKQLDTLHFILFCKAIFPYLNPQYRELFYSNLKVLGETLLRLCEAQSKEIESTTAREMVLYYLTDALLRAVENIECRQLGEKIVSLLLQGHPFTPLVGIHLINLKKKAFPNGISPAIPVNLTLRIKAIRSLIERRNIESAIPEAVRMVNDEFPIEVTSVIEDELVNLWSILKSKVEELQVPPFKQALLLAHNETVIAKHFYFCMDVHLLLINLLDQMYVKLQRTTLEDVLIISLKCFLSRVPKHLSEQYSKALVQLLSRSWTPTNPLSKVCLNLIKQHYAWIALQLKNDLEAQTTLLTQIYNCGASEATLQGSMIDVVEKALSDPSTSPSDQCTHLKLARKIYSTTHPRLSLDTLFLFALRCFELQQITVGLEWVQAAFDLMHSQNQVRGWITPDALVRIYESLFQCKNYGVLSELFLKFQKLNGCAYNVIHLFQEPLLNHNIETSFQIFMALAGTDENRGHYSAIVEQFILSLTARNDIKEEFWLDCQTLLLTYKFENLELWKLCHDNLIGSKSTTIKTKAALTFIDGLQLLPQGSVRFHMWMDYYNSDVKPLIKVVQALINQKKLFYTIFYDPTTENVDNELFSFLMIAFKQLLYSGEKINTQSIFDVYLELKNLPHKDIPETTHWQLRELFMALMQSQVSLEIYVQLFLYVKTLLASLPEQDRDDHYVSNMMIQFFQINVKNGNTQDVHGKMMLEIIRIYGGELWLTRTFCYATKISTLNCCEILKITTEMYLEAHKVITEQVRVEFKIAFMDMVDIANDLQRPLLISLLYHKSVALVLGNYRDLVVDRCIKNQFNILTVQDVPVEEERFERQMEIIKKGFECFYPFLQPYGVNIQKSIFMCSVEAVIHAITIAPQGKGFVAVPYIQLLCKQQYASGVAYTRYYENLNLIVSLIEHKVGKSDRSLFYNILNSIYGRLLLIESESGFSNIIELASLIDRYCFETQVEYVKDVAVYDFTVVTLFSIMNTIALQHPEVPFFKTDQSYSLRGPQHKFSYLNRMAISSVKSNLIKVVQFLQGKFTDQYRLLRLQKIEVLQSLIHNLKERADHNYRKMFVQLTEIVIHLYDESFAAKVYQEMRAITDVMQEMLVIMQNSLINDIPRDFDTLHTWDALSFERRMSKFIHDMGVRALFDKCPQYYWKIQRQICDAVLKIPSNLEFVFAVSLEQGLYVLDPKCIYRIEGHLLEPSEDYLYCKKHWIDDHVDRAIETGIGGEIIEMLSQLPCIKDFPNHPILDEIKARFTAALP